MYSTNYTKIKTKKGRIMPRPKGAENNPRNRMIIDLKQKGYSYNAINRELIKSGFYISVQRVAEVVKQGLYKK
tara:strand:- start:25 stop:243 length:219 start_codon:yes stop_codon:yes gene_type:complete